MEREARETDRQTDRQTGRQTDRQTDKQTETQPQQRNKQQQGNDIHVHLLVVNFLFFTRNAYYYNLSAKTDQTHELPQSNRYSAISDMFYSGNKAKTLPSFCMGRWPLTINHVSVSVCLAMLRYN